MTDEINYKFCIIQLQKKNVAFSSCLKVLTKKIALIIDCQMFLFMLVVRTGWYFMVKFVELDFQQLVAKESQ